MTTTKRSPTLPFEPYAEGDFVEYRGFGGEYWFPCQVKYLLRTDRIFPLYRVTDEEGNDHIVMHFRLRRRRKLSVVST